MTGEIEDFRKFLELEQSKETPEARIISFLVRLSEATYVGAVEALCKEEIAWLVETYQPSALPSWLAKYETAMRAYFQEHPILEPLACKRKTPTGIVNEHVAHLILRASASRLSTDSRQKIGSPPKRQNARPAFTLNESTPANSQPSPANTQPIPTNIQPSPTNIQPSPANIQPIPANIQPFNLPLDEALVAEISDRQRWGEGSPTERLTRIIAKAKMADKLQAELKIEQENVTALIAQVKLLEAREAALLRKN
ncbi:MAG: hypothetical protein AAGF01_07050 [Cyanobacteria bacterium P01_G01_bin.38]